MFNGRKWLWFVLLGLVLCAHTVDGEPLWTHEFLGGAATDDHWAVSAASDTLAWALYANPNNALRKMGGLFTSSWETVPLSHISSGDTLRDIFVLPTSPQWVWIVGVHRDEDDVKGFILRTTNACDDEPTWSIFEPLGGTPEKSVPFYAVCFADTATGYISCGNGILLKTINRGEEWRETSRPGSRSDCMLDVWTPMNDGSKVWTICDNRSIVAKSENGGGGWTRYDRNELNRSYSIPDVGADYGGKLALSDVSFSSFDNGAMATSHGKVCRVSSGGSSWSVDSLEPKSTWFEASDYGLQDTLFLVGGDGVIHEACGSHNELAYHNRFLDLHDVDMANSVGWAVGDYYTGVDQPNRRFVRYEPASFEFDSLKYTCYETSCSVKVYWTVHQETNTYIWRFHYSVTPFLHPEEFKKKTCDARGNSDEDTSYCLGLGILHGKNTTYHMWITVEDLEYSYQYCWWDSLEVQCPGWESTDTLDRPGNFNAADKPDDEGGVVDLTWQQPSNMTDVDGYRIGRSTEPDGPYYMQGDDCLPETLFSDGNALTGKNYYYKICSVGGAGWKRSATVLDNAHSIDNEPPDAVQSLKYVRQVRDPDSIFIWLEWSEDTDDTTLAGYWVSAKEQVDPNRTVVNKAPIQRNWYVLCGDWHSGATVSAGVLPMDYSDGMQDNWLDINMFIANHHVDSWEATGNSNANRIAQSLDEDLHFGFTSSENDTDFVYYQTSTDDGESWTTPTSVGRGRDPCLCLTTGGSPYMVWRMTEPNGSNLNGKLYFSKYSQGQWITPVQIYSTTAPGFAVGSPAAATSKNLSHVVWEARELRGMGYADIVFAGFLDLNSGSPQLTYEPIDTVWTGATPSDSTEVSPTIDVDLNTLPHAAWQKGNDIYYAAKGPSGWPGSSHNISGTASKESRNAHIDIQGDWIRVLWEEQHSSSAEYYDALVWSHWKNASLWTAQTSTISSNCLEPLIDGNFILWSEKVGDYYEVFVSAYDYETYSWGDSSNISNYPYGDSRYPQLILEAIRSYEEPEIFCAWTEGSVGYWTMVHKKTFDKKQPYYPHDLGLETQSPVTVERDGYISYGSSTYETVDYDTDTLKYECNLDSAYDYTLELTYYHEGGSGRNYELLIDGAALDTSSVPSEQKVTVEESVPDSAVLDGQITIEVTSTGGDTVTCGDFLLFQSSPEAGMGGGQAVKRRRGALPLIPMLNAPRPNPSRGRPVIEYFLPDERRTTVHVFDVSGRLVETIASGRQKPGWHRVAWNTDNNGAGVYFCRMNAGDVQMAHKLILVR